MRRSSYMPVIAFIAALACGGEAQQQDHKPPAIAVQQPTEGIDAIMAYQGTWKVQGERFTTAYSTAGKEDTTLRNDCWKSGGYVACNQFVNGESKVLIVYTYNDLLKMYNTFPIQPNGQAATSGRLQIVGNVWTYPWEVTQAGTTTYFHVVNVFTGPGHIDYSQEFSPDNLHWTPMAKGSENKVGN